MKKLSLLVALALLVAIGAFAQVSLDYSVTGDAQMLWGIRLDDQDQGKGQAHGFETSTNSTMDLTVTLDPASVTKSGEGVYGEITLSGFGVNIGEGQGIKYKDSFREYDKDGDWKGAKDSSGIVSSDLDAKFTDGREEFDYTFIETGIAVKNPKVEAKIVLSDALFVKIASKPDFDSNLDTIADDSWTKVDFNMKGGVTVGYMSDAIDFNAMVGSYDNDFEKNKYDNYYAGFDTTVKAIDILSINARAYYNEAATIEEDTVNGKLVDWSHKDKTDGLWYIGLGLSSTPIDILTVNFDVAVEILPQDGKTGIDNKMGDEGMDIEMDLDIPVKISDSFTVTPRASFGTNTTRYNEVAITQDMNKYMGTTIALPSEDDAKTAYEGDLDLQLKLDLTGDLSLSITATAKDILPHSFNKDWVEYESVHGDKTQEYDNMTAKLDVKGSYKYSLSDSTYVKPGFDTTYDAKHTNVREWVYYYNEDGKKLNGNTEYELSCEGQEDDVWDIDVYLEAGLIDNTVFKLNWHSDQLLDMSDYKDDKIGDVTFTTKISY